MSPPRSPAAPGTPVGTVRSTRRAEWGRVVPSDGGIGTPSQAGAGPAVYEYAATVVAVHDGDTVTLAVDCGLRVAVTDKFRLYGPDPAGREGLDAPELGTPEGEAARAFLAGLLASWGPTVRVRTVKDRKEKYGRWLAVVLDPATGASANQLLIDAGHAAPKRY